MIDFFLQGGIFMFFLVALSILALGVIIWRGYALRRSAVLPQNLIEAIEKFRPEEPPTKLLQLVDKQTAPLAIVIRVLLGHIHWPIEEAREAVQTTARREIAHLEKGLVFLEMATGVAPLFGLLGTLSGLVNVFANLGEGGDPAQVARGISEALNTTIVGLSVAAPSLVAYHYFVRKVEMMSIEMESLLGDLVIKLFQLQKQTSNQTKKTTHLEE
ncbi:MAG: MotA/TolQ/ExbB proton channel family protein [Chthoniobacterales bacterium]|nr:MotA/TolQ/ExbB proton channel family protein [Chthoniobacterales bacterium]MCX7712953.1 MotA/TolQ/ExbB proton channel family protein [Chthoniobacterales bacterium]